MRLLETEKKKLKSSQQPLCWKCLTKTYLSVYQMCDIHRSKVGDEKGDLGFTKITPAFQIPTTPGEGDTMRDTMRKQLVFHLNCQNATKHWKSSWTYGSFSHDTVVPALDHLSGNCFQRQCQTWPQPRGYTHLSQTAAIRDSWFRYKDSKIETGNIRPSPFVVRQSALGHIPFLWWCMNCKSCHFKFQCYLFFIDAYRIFLSFIPCLLDRGKKDGRRDSCWNNEGFVTELYGSCLFMLYWERIKKNEN